MLIAFLMRNEADWHSWRQQIENFPGKSVIHVTDNDPALLGLGGVRHGAIDEVESFDDDEDDEEEVNRVRVLAE